MCKHFKDCDFLLQRVIAAPQVLSCSCQLERKKAECIRGELFLCNYTEIKKGTLSSRVNFWEILPPSCRVVASDCYAPGSISDGLTERVDKCIQ